MAIHIPGTWTAEELAEHIREIDEAILKVFSTGQSYLLDTERSQLRITRATINDARSIRDEWANRYATLTGQSRRRGYIVRYNPGVLNK